MIRQKKEIDHFLECKDEVSQICYDQKSNHLFIGDDAGKVTKYDLTEKTVDLIRSKRHYTMTMEGVLSLSEDPHIVHRAHSPK